MVLLLTETLVVVKNILVDRIYLFDLDILEGGKPLATNRGNVTAKLKWGA